MRLILLLLPLAVHLLALPAGAAFHLPVPERITAAVGAASVSVGETAYPWHNGWARVATAEYPAGGRITLRIAPERAGEGTVEPDLATLKDRLRQGILPVLPDDHAKMAADAMRHAGTLRTDGSWPDIDYLDNRVSSWLASQHMGRLLVLAKAWADPGGPAYHNAELGAKALSALTWWLDHDYPNANWWWQQIGTPQLIGESALLLEPRLDADRAAKLHTIMERAKYTPGQGQNTVWLAANVMLRGCLEDDPAQVADGFRGIWGEVHFATTSEGLQPDFSFHQHNDQFYNGGYGLPFGNDIARYIACADGTRWQAPKPVVDLITRYLLDAQQWMICGRIFDFSAVGREITRQGKVAVNRSWTASPISGSGTPVGAAYGIWNAAMLMARVKGPRQAEFAAFARRLGGDPLAPPLSGNRHFPYSDYMAHQRPGWFASVRMFSTRTLNAEVVNAEGLRSHHLADGANLLYRTGEEYTDIFPCWDWEMVPGTTAERTGVFTPKLVQSRGMTSFVGGVSDGTYGCAAMDLWRGALAARKAWFFFDGQYAALGAGITDTSSAPVSTAVNQCRMREPAPMLHALPDGGHWTWHGGVGYLFPPGQDVRMAAGPQTGRWSDIGAGPSDPVTMDVFRLWIEHGSRPSGASYAYIVEPGVNAKKAADDATALPLEIVSNTPAVQAVHHPRLGVLQAAFYLPGSVSAGPGWTIRVDRPCLAMLRRVPGGIVLSVSNPTNEPATVTVEIDRHLSGKGCTPSPMGTRVRVELPGGARAGASMVRRLDEPGPAAAVWAGPRGAG